MIPLALVLAQTNSGFPAKLGTTYLIGPESHITGTKQKIEVGNQRLVTLKAARTALAFGAEQETILAAKGRLLVIFEATIKNPEKSPISITNADTFGIRVYDSGLKAGDVVYRGSFTPTGQTLRFKLKHNESADVVSVYEFPATLENLKVGPYYHTFIASKTPKYDLTTLVSAEKSLFARSALSYVDSASVSERQPFDLGDLKFSVIQIRPHEGGWAVKVEVSNPYRFPSRWGWQYGKAYLVDAQDNAVANYPDFTVEDAFKDWGFEVKPGQTIRGEYKFFPTGVFKPKTFRLIPNASQRSVDVVLAGATP